MTEEELLGDLPDLLTIPMICERLPIAERTVRRWVAEGRLPAYHFGRRLLIRRVDLEATIVPITSA